MERRRWGSWEDHHLVSAYRNVPTPLIAAELRRTAVAVKLRASYLGLVRRTPRWSSEEDELLRHEYREISARFIGMRLHRGRGGVYRRASRLGLVRTISPTSRRRWTQAEDEVLKGKYGQVRPLELARTLKRTRAAVWHRTKRIGLFARLGSGEYLRRQGLPRSARPFTGLRDPAERGYVAGIIDGEGSVGLPPKVFISVTTTTKALAVRLQMLAGGSVAGPYSYQKTKVFGSKRCRIKPQYHWNYASRAHVYLLLKAIQPYLVVKAREARKGLKYLENKLGWGAQ